MRRQRRIGGLLLLTACQSNSTCAHHDGQRIYYLSCISAIDFESDVTADSLVGLESSRDVLHTISARHRSCHNAHSPLIVKMQTRPTIGIAAARRPCILRSGSVLGKPNGSLALGLHRTPSRPASMAPASAINYGGTSSHSRLVGAGLGPIYVLACWTKRHGAYHRVGEAKE